jgi:hypothetical protein
MKKIFWTTLLAAASIGLATPSFAKNEAKETYTAAKKHADAEYKTSRAKCDSLKGNDKDVCVEEAKAKREKAKAEAKFHYKHTLGALTSARKKSAEADYDVAEEKCDALKGNDKDVCMKEAKANKVAAKADAKTDKKVVKAIVAGEDDKLNAEYKVAKEKCDALSGANKDACMDKAKNEYGR